jgi:hypothetical protein
MGEAFDRRRIISRNRPDIAPVGVTVFDFRPFWGPYLLGENWPYLIFTGRYWPTFIYLFILLGVNSELVVH